jgi:bacillithiol biosynthesis cysteine-adding enzyme BshC
MYQEPLGAAVLEVLNSFEHGFPDSDIRGETVAWLRRHYRPEATVAGGFGAALAELLAPLGVLCFDPTHPAAKRAAAPIMLRALAAAGKLDGALVHRAASLEAAGRGSSVAVGDGASLVFLEGPLGRDRLMTDGQAFITRRGRIRYTESELRRIAEEAPTRFSANVLLRAVVESALLPTVAYAAGPAELRYLALAQPVYQEFGIAQQLPVPRWSGLLVEPRVTRILDKFATSVEELATEGAGLEARLVRQSLPEGTEAAFAALQAAIEQYFAPVARNAAAVDPTLERPVQSARGKALHAAKKLEHKVLRLARKREGVELAQVARARLSLRPEGKPQERVLSMVGFMARYGGGVVDGLATHIEGWYARALEAGAPTP